jgi:hypothetical protein
MVLSALSVRSEHEEINEVGEVESATCRS